MTDDSLNALTRKELAQKARKRGIAGWHGMKKKELVEALLTVTQQRKRQGANGNGRARRREPAAAPERHSPVRLRIQGASPVTPVRDSLVAEVLDPHWVHLRWTLSGRMVARAETSLGSEWHSAIPVIRVVDITGEGTGSEQSRHVKDVEITGEAETWYVPVEDASRTYRMHIGYRARNGQFFSLAKSRKVQMPRPGSSARLARPGVVSRKSGRVPIPSALRGATVRRFDIEAELVVHGNADPYSQVTLLGETVELDEDGYFSIRVSLPEGRQVIPAVSVTPTGDEQRTIVLAIERNTKQLEPESLVEA